MKIVTGGAGFIGSNLLAVLEAAGEGPLVLCDRLRNGSKWKNIAKRTLKDIVLPEDLPAFLEDNRSSIEVIFHLGAISSTLETDVDRILANNIRFSCDLFRWCANNNKRFIYASSAATYGNGAQGFVDCEDLEGLRRYRPLNPYGWSKHFFDLYVAQAVHAREKLPPQYAGLKFFNVYGPNEYHKEGQRSVAHQIHPFAVRGEAFNLFKSHNPAYSDGGQKRDFVWVDDCCNVMRWLADNPQHSGLFNVGSGTTRTFFELATAVYRANGNECRVAYREIPTALRDQYQYFTEAPMGKLLRLGYDTPFQSLEQGIELYVQSYLLKADPYR